MAFFGRTIRPEIPRSFFERLPEAIDSAFASAHLRAASEGRVLPEQLAHARGTDRYFAVQRNVVETVTGLGGEAVALRAGAFPMPIVRFGRFLLATSITERLDGLRGSSARSLLARLNSGLEHQQGDLFGEKHTVDGMRFGLVLVAKPNRGSDPSLPAGIYFGVPTTSLQSWHFYGEVGSILALYEGTEAEEKNLMRKLPTLRRVPRSAQLGDKATS